MPNPETGVPANPRAGGVGCPPVLFLIFNRPELTLRTFARIREAKPARLFIAADGPRTERLAERLLCEQSRIVVENVDWDCEVHTSLQVSNLGCKRAVSSAITWFFENVEEGIILEDDCLPHPDFFPFCQAMLERYRFEERVMQTCGGNAVGRWKARRQSYHFSLYGGIWGWATWRRAWLHYDPEARLWGDPERRAAIRRTIGNAAQFDARRTTFDAAYSGSIDTWDYQWTLARLARQGLSIVPCVNLISNIGFGPDATHTHSVVHPMADQPTYDLPSALRFRKTIRRDTRYDVLYSRLHGHTRQHGWRRIAHRIRRVVEAAWT